jgi:hypothetical protein
MAGLRVLRKCLADVEGVDITIVMAFGARRDGPELIGRADGVVLFVSEGARWVQEDPWRPREVQGEGRVLLPAEGSQAVGRIEADPA